MNHVLAFDIVRHPCSVSNILRRLINCCIIIIIIVVIIFLQHIQCWVGNGLVT